MNEKTDVYLKMAADDEHLLAEVVSGALGKLGDRAAGIVIHVLWINDPKESLGRPYSTSTAAAAQTTDSAENQSKAVLTLLKEIPDHAKEWAERMKKHFGVG